MQFVANHWVLFLALVVIIALLVMEEKKGVVAGVQKLSPQGAINLINHENAQIVDVRTALEFRTGHLMASINIAITDLEQNINKLAKYKNKPIILVCGSGQVSLKAGAILSKHGFARVYALTGGIMGWQRFGLPLTKD